MAHRLSAVLIGGIAAIVFGQIASAADLPRKAPAYTPPPPPVIGWTGFYAGLNAGYHWSSNNSVSTLASPGPFDASQDFGPDSDAAALSATSSLSPKQNGFIGGGQIGYNWQFAPNWVTGIEADIQGLAHNNGDASITSAVTAVGFPDTFTSTTVLSKRLDWLGTVRGRLGVLVNPTLLVYGTGGLAYGEAKAATAISQTATCVFFCPNPINYGTAGSFSETRAGWTLGGGLEWMIARHWTLKGEYLYYDLGRVTFALPRLSGFAPGCNTDPCWSADAVSTTKFNGSIVRVGINYLFN